MNFIIDNYLWFGIAGVILLMALIGFLAEKTNFIVGSNDKPKKKKKSKKKTPNEFMDDEVVEEPVEEVANTIPAEETASTSVEETPVNEEVLDFGTIASQTEPTIESAPLNVNDTWTQVTEPVTPTPVVTETGEDLSQPFGEPIKAPTESVQTESKAKESDTPTTTADEDIWKF